MRRAALALACLAFGCGGDFKDDYHRVDGLRLLAVKAEPPEGREGAKFTLTAVAVNRDGSPIDVQWIACLVPAFPGQGTLNPLCFEDPPQQYLFPIGAGLAISGTFIVPPKDPRIPQFPDATGGIYLPIRMDISTPDESLSAAYRFRYADGGQPPNSNPKLQSIFAGDKEFADSPLPVRAGDKLALRAGFAAGSIETYKITRDDGTTRDATEQLNIAWFATAGAFDNGSTGDMGATTLDLGRAPPAPGATVDLWAVGRDERGGSDVIHRTLKVQ